MEKVTGVLKMKKGMLKVIVSLVVLASGFNITHAATENLPNLPFPHWFAVQENWVYVMDSNYIYANDVQTWYYVLPNEEDGPWMNNLAQDEWSLGFPQGWCYFLIKNRNTLETYVYHSDSETWYYYYANVRKEGEVLRGIWVYDFTLDVWATMF